MTGSAQAAKAVSRGIVLRGAVLLSVALAASPLYAELAPCREDAPLGAVIAALSAEGWQVAEGDLTEAETDALAWILMAAYLASDTGGEAVAQLYEIQRRAAPGLLAKVDTEATQSRVLFGPLGAMTLTQIRVGTGQILRNCRAALTLPPQSDDFDRVIGLPEMEGVPAALVETVTLLDGGDEK